MLSVAVAMEVYLLACLAGCLLLICSVAALLPCSLCLPSCFCPQNVPCLFGCLSVCLFARLVVCSFV